jgi:hypothetical protein
MPASRKGLEDENTKLKKLLADTMLDNAILKDGMMSHQKNLVRPCVQGFMVRKLLCDAANSLLTRNRGSLALKGLAMKIAKLRGLRKTCVSLRAVWPSSCTACCVMVLCSKHKMR